MSTSWGGTRGGQWGGHGTPLRFLTHTHTKTKWFLLLPLTNTSLIFVDNSSDLPVDLIIEKTAPKSCYHNKQVGCWFDLWV